MGSRSANKLRSSSDFDAWAHFSLANRNGVLVEPGVQVRRPGCFPAIADMREGTNHRIRHFSSGDNPGYNASPVCNGVMGAQETGGRGGSFARRTGYEAGVVTTRVQDTDVLIAGAGVIGISSALWAQRRGMSVVLADRNPPGSGASFGNAGIIANYGCVPVNSPSLIRDVPKMLASKSGPLRVDWMYAMRNMPWMLSFMRNCTTARVRHITDSLGDILSRTDAGLDPLVAAAGAEELFVNNDLMNVWSTQQGWTGAATSLESRRRNGVVFDLLSGADIGSLEPGIALPFHAGIRIRGGRHVRDPHALMQRLFDRFIADGGSFVETGINTVEPNDNGVNVTCSNGSTYYTGQVVIAAGAHSRSILGSGAEDLPLGTERGYHLVFAGHGHLISRPVSWVERGFYATPMDGGLRFAGTVEITGLDEPPTQARIDALTRCVHEMFGNIGAPTSNWLGFRPTMPDSLPVIGRSHRSERILLAFGHQHLGLTLGGVTGRTVADLLEGRASNFDISPFDPARFGKNGGGQSVTG